MRAQSVCRRRSNKCVKFAFCHLQTLFGLTAFCVTSAIAIGWIYCMQASWVVAWLVIDERRIESKRDGCLPCIKYSPDWKPNKFSQRQLGVEVMAYYAKLLDYKLYKVGTSYLSF